jgi:hypothetical protein
MDNFEYDNLINNWHMKAEEDYFSRFSFEFLSFIAFVKTQISTKEKMIEKTRKSNPADRDYIQALKQDTYYRSAWINLISNDNQIRNDLDKLINELNRSNLLSEKDWWDCDSFNITNKNGQYPDQGLIRGYNDYTNLIEVWYVVRNTLFHGGKNPSRDRDKILVEYCYKTLARFMGDIALPHMNKKRLYPAIWEDFFERFLDGTAEVNTKYDSSGAAANIYELVFLDEPYFPCLIGDKIITKDLLISEINHRLAICADDEYRDKIFRLKNAANNDVKKNKLQEYFGDTIMQLEKLWGKT